jgi:prophage regulatory protein
MSWLIINDTEKIMYQLNPEHNRFHQESRQRQKLIRIKSVVNLTGLSKSYIYQLVTSGHFPLSVKLVPGGTSVAWIESEIEGWIQSRIQERDEGDIKNV